MFPATLFRHKPLAQISSYLDSCMNRKVNSSDNKVGDVAKCKIDASKANKERDIKASQPKKPPGNLAPLTHANGQLLNGVASASVKSSTAAVDRFASNVSRSPMSAVKRPLMGMKESAYEQETEMKFDAAKEFLFKEMTKSTRAYASIKKILLRMPELANLQDAKGNTLLHMLLANPGDAILDSNLVDLLLDNMNEESINFYNEIGPVLHQECSRSAPRVEIVIKLIRRGADPTLLDVNHRNILNFVKETNIRKAVYYVMNAKIVKRDIPDLDSLKARFTDDRLAYNMQQCMQAVRFVRYEVAIGAPNNLKDPRKTNNWSTEIHAHMHKEFLTRAKVRECYTWVYDSVMKKHVKFRKYLPKFETRFSDIRLKAELVSKYRCGDCGYQSAAAFMYMFKKGHKDVEAFYFENGNHFFVVKGRVPNSDPKNPATWGPSAVVCDPWLNVSYPATEYYKNREFNMHTKGEPTILVSYQHSQSRFANDS